MCIRPTIDREQVERAQGEFHTAETHFSSATQYRREVDNPNYAANFVSAQRSIERSTKSIFKLMNVQHPNEHVISPSSGEGLDLLNSIKYEVQDINYPQQEVGIITEEEIVNSHVRGVARILFLCEMYGNMYPLSSYGIDEEDFELPADDIIEQGEVGGVLESAITGLRIADAVIDSIATGELPQTYRPSGPEGPMENRSGISHEYYGVGRRMTDGDPVSDFRRELE